MYKAKQSWTHEERHDAGEGGTTTKLSPAVTPVGGIAGQRAEQGRAGQGRGKEGVVLFLLPTGHSNDEHHHAAVTYGTLSGRGRHSQHAQKAQHSIGLVLQYDRFRQPQDRMPRHTWV